MALSIATRVAWAMSVLPHELGCDECFEYLAAYADHLTSGTAESEALRLVGEHLERCLWCMEEFQLLRKAMKNTSSGSL